MQPNREASLFYQHPPEGFSKEYPEIKMASQNPVLAIWPEGHTYTKGSLSVRASFQNWISFFGIALRQSKIVEPIDGIKYSF